MQLALLFLSAALNVSAVCNPYPLPAYLSGYVPFTLVNSSNTIASTSLYVTITGTNPSTNNTCMVQFSNAGGKYVGTLVDSTSAAFSVNLNSLEYSYLLSSLPQQNGQPVLYVPPISNATLYLSVGYQMGLLTANGSSYGIQTPQPFTTTDANYYHLYDSSIFFTIGTDLNFQSLGILDYSLPISSIVSMNNGTSVQYAGLNIPRNTMLTSYSTAVAGIANAAAQTQWDKLLLSFTSASGTGATELRLASTLSAMGFQSSPFDPSYLINNSGTYGADWASTVFDVTNVYFDVSALPPPAGEVYTTYLYTGVTGGNLVFTSQGTAGIDVTIPYPFSNSFPFLNASATGSDSFSAAGDPLAAPLICNLLSTGFVTGLFPAADTSSSNPFGNNYAALANVNNQIYQENSAFPAMSGPWYDLYAAVLHDAAQGSPYFNFEADTVDTFVGFFSPIVVPNNSDSQPSVFVVLNDCTSTVIPNFADSTMYSVLIANNPSNTNVLLNGATPPMSQTTVSVPFTLEITYNTGLYSGNTYTCQAWVNNTNNYSVVFPQPPGVISCTYNSGGGYWNIAIPDSP